MLLSIVAVLVVLSPIIIVHEFGHYLACRMTGIRVNEFSFGFGKILWHKKMGDTDYQLRAIPFGGFVEPAGPMFHPQNAQEPPKPYEFAAKKWYAKFFMVVNGAVFNYLLAAVIFSIIAYISGVAETNPVRLPPVVGTVAENYPAQKIGLQEGDRIIRVNGTSISNWKELSEALSQRKGDIALTYLHGDKEENVVVRDKDFNPHYFRYYRPTGFPFRIPITSRRLWIATMLLLDGPFFQIYRAKFPPKESPRFGRSYWDCQYYSSGGTPRPTGFHFSYWVTIGSGRNVQSVPYSRVRRRLRPCVFRRRNYPQITDGKDAQFCS